MSAQDFLGIVAASLAGTMSQMTSYLRKRLMPMM